MIAPWEGNCKTDNVTSRATKKKKLTSASSPCTRPPAALTNPQTIPASSSASLLLLLFSLLLPSSAEEAPSCCCAAVEGDCGCCDVVAGRKREICPAVLRIAPEDRSSAMVALTPDFFKRRLNVSSRASGPLV